MAGEKILVIGSDVELLKTVSEQVLSPRGFKPLLAKGQNEGVKVAVAESPHLLLLHLPVDVSARLLDRLAQHDHVIPSVLMLEHLATHLDVELLRLGVRDCVFHPFVPEDMLQAIHRVFEQQAERPNDQRLAEDLAVPERGLERRIDEFKVLLRIGRSVSSLSDLNSVLKRVAEAAVFFTGADSGYLLLLDGETGKLRLRAAQNVGEKQARGFSLPVEDRVAQTVVASGKPLLLSNENTHTLQVKTGYLLKSQLNLPLKVNGRVIGVLGVGNHGSDASFARTQLPRLSALADLVAASVENARRYTELNQQFTCQVRQVAALQEMAGQLGAITEFDAGARLALSLALKATNAEAGVLAWAAEEERRPASYVSQGSLGELVLTPGSSAAPARWWDEQTLRGVIETGQPILEEDLDHRGNGRNSHARSQLAVPMRRGTRVMGAINLESTSPRAFNQDDLEFVHSVADQVAIALEGTVLHEKAEIERERLSLLMDAVDNMVWVVDPDLRLVAQNEAVGEVLGWSSAEAVGRSVHELASSNQAAAHDLCYMLSQVMEKRQRFSFPQRGTGCENAPILETRHGRSIRIKGRGVPLVEDGRVVGAICAFREVLPEGNDEHVRFEFANMASHLLRSPLSFIQASLDLMLNSELDAEEQRAMLDKMREQSQRIREFIKDLLEMSRLETGSVRVYPEPVVLPPVIERVLDLIRPEEPRYEFSFMAPATFPIVAADPGKTELVLLGMLRSAMSRCPNGGRISLELSAHTSEAVISVTDDGEIVPTRQLDRIFSQFYPVDDDVGKMPSTYELGLYTTKRLIELQNGRVWAESQPGKGTRLGFSLPIWGVSR